MRTERKFDKMTDGFRPRSCVTQAAASAPSAVVDGVYRLRKGWFSIASAILSDPYIVLLRNSIRTYTNILPWVALSPSADEFSNVFLSSRGLQWRQAHTFLTWQHQRTRLERKLPAGDVTSVYQRPPPQTLRMATNWLRHNKVDANYYGNESQLEVMVLFKKRKQQLLSAMSTLIDELMDWYPLSFAN